VKLTDFSQEFLNGIIDIEKQSFERPWTRVMFESSAANKMVSFKVAVENGEVAGYCIYWITGEETEILNIAVSTKFRRQSYARAMLSEVVEKSKKEKSKAVFLDVRAGNEPAKKLYASAGFEKTAVRKNYYGSEDALVLKKNL